MIPRAGPQRRQRLDPAVHAMRIEIEDAEDFLRQGSVFKDVVRPQTALAFFGIPHKNMADLLELSVHHRIAPDHGDDAGEIRCCAQPCENYRLTYPRMHPGFQKPCAVGTSKIALVGNVDADDRHLIGTSHPHNSAMAKILRRRRSRSGSADLIDIIEKFKLPRRSKQ